MARLRVFVSSTYFDLRHIRSSMEGFIESMGYEPVLFESGDIPFHHDISLAESCYNEVNNSHMLVLIIGGRYGSAAEERKKKTPENEITKMYETYNSVTKKEYETARNKDIPIFIFVEKGVKAEYETFKANRQNSTIKFAHVDNISIFMLLDEILAQQRNNYVKEFDKFEDIVAWLRDQWAGIFADLLSKKKDSSTLKDMSAQISQLSEVTKAMKEYTESIMRKVQPDNYEKIIRRESSRLRNSKARAFCGEDMIRFIFRKNEGLIVSTTKTFQAFEKSKSVDDFLSRIGIPSGFIETFMKEHGDHAREDYEEYRGRYLDTPSGD